MESRDWLRSVAEIEQNSKRVWGQLKTVTGQNAKVFAPKENISEAKKVIEKGEEVLAYCDVTTELANLRMWISDAASWDEKYKKIREAANPDGVELTRSLKEAQTKCVKSAIMIAALAEMKRNKVWIKESQRYFNNTSRKELSQRSLKELIMTMDALKNSVTAR